MQFPDQYLKAYEITKRQRIYFLTENKDMKLLSIRKHFTEENMLATQ